MRSRHGGAHGAPTRIPLASGRHVTGVPDPFNGHIDAFRISHIQRSDGSIAYSTNPARIGSQGGFSRFSTGFNGRIYLAALYRRSFTPREVHLRARDPYRVIRRPLATARAAQGSAPPPVGDSGKGSIVIAITC